MSKKTQRYLSAVIVACSVALLVAPLPARAGGFSWLPPIPRLEDVDLYSYLLEQQALNKPIETEPVLPKPSTTVSRAATYVVQKGDTLWGLARRFGVSVSDLQQWNGISGSLIKIGQKLNVSAPTRSLASRSGSRVSYNLLWPVVGTVTSGWGYRTRFEKFHYGLDIAAPTGTPIIAASAGVVEFAGWKNGYGYCVFLDHGNGLKTAYGHASKLYVKPGDYVAAGQEIAAVGSTGFSTGPHVHLEVRINGRLVDPATVLPKLKP